MNIFEHIISTSRLLKSQKEVFKRDIAEKINWDFPVVGIVGQRGVGKTTLLIQKLSEKKNGIYFSADNIKIIEYGIFELISEFFHEYGVDSFYIDEIHKFQNWEQEIKNATDSFPGISIVFSGSSSIDILSHSIDLSRRVLLYKMFPLSFREYVGFKYKIILPKLLLEDVFLHHKKISFEYSPLLKNKYLEEYKKEYMYFFREQVNSTEEFHKLLENTLKKTIYEDIGRLYSLNSQKLISFEKLLFLFSNIQPSEMSYAKIAKKTNLDPKTVEYYISILEKSDLVHTINMYDSVTNYLLKSKKIFVSNTNISALYRSGFSEKENTGMQREIFFVSCIKQTTAQISLHSKQDFLVKHKNKTYICEIGGANKKISKPSQNTFIIADNIKVSEGNKIPSWMFGCL